MVCRFSDDSKCEFNLSHAFLMNKYLAHGIDLLQSTSDDVFTNLGKNYSPM